MPTTVDVSVLAPTIDIVFPSGTTVDTAIETPIVSVEINTPTIDIEIGGSVPGATGPQGIADERQGGILLGDPSASVFASGNSKGMIRIPVGLNGMSLINVGASCTTAASSGTTTIQYRRVRAGVADVNILSTPVTIDSGEIDSITAATSAVINAANRGVLTGDQIHFDVTTVGAGALGIFATFTFKEV